MNKHCKCEMAGKCNRHGVIKTQREYHLCKGLNCTAAQCLKYWNAWEEGRMPGQESPVDTPLKLEWDVSQPSRGLGDTIAKFTNAVGIKSCGGCKKRQEALNKLIPFKTR